VTTAAKAGADPLAVCISLAAAPVTSMPAVNTTVIMVFCLAIVIAGLSSR
jgi:hypothetical protein